MNEKKIERAAEGYFKKYRTQIESLEKNSLLAKARGVNDFDRMALGKQLDMWEEYTKFVMDENGNLNNLGKLPQLAFDIITVMYGQSVLPIIASTQPIEEQSGIVYFQNIRALDSKGNITSGDRLLNPKTGAKTQTGYSSNEISNVDLGLEFDETETAFTFVLPANPVLRESFKVSLSASVYGQDIGPAEGASPDVGRIIGAGVHGTINYVTGSVTLNFATAPADTAVATATYQQNYEASTDIPRIESFMDSTEVRSKVYALKGTIGMLTNFAMKKRFGGSVMEEALATTLVAEINKEVGGDAIRLLRAGALSGETFSKAVPTGAAYSKREHYQDYMIALSLAEKQIVDATQRGAISVMVVGTEQAAIIKNLYDFDLLYDSNKIGPHVYGKIGNVIVVRVPEAAILGSAQGFGLHKGMQPWEAGLVHAPYMPLALTDMLPTGANPLTSQRAAATMAGLKSVVPSFAAKLDIVA